MSAVPDPPSASTVAVSQIVLLAALAFGAAWLWRKAIR